MEEADSLSAAPELPGPSSTQSKATGLYLLTAHHKLRFKGCFATLSCEYSAMIASGPAQFSSARVFCARPGALVLRLFLAQKA